MGAEDETGGVGNGETGRKNSSLQSSRLPVAQSPRLPVSSSPRPKLSRAAVLLAAGRSRRVGAFKPLLPFGGGSVVRACVESLREAGGGEGGGAGGQPPDARPR